MAVTTFPVVEKLASLVDLQIHQIALKNFHYHTTGTFPYNLLICVLASDMGADDVFINCVTGQKIHLRPDHAYILPCHVPVQYKRTPDVTGVTMRFNLTLFSGIDIFDGCQEINDLYAPELTALLKHDICRPDAPETEQLRAAFALKSAVSQICLSCWPEHRMEFPLGMWKYEEIFRYVRDSGDATLSVSKLAELCGMRQDVFSRSFIRDTGKSPKQFISDFLIRKISARLLSSTMTLKEIARELNFNSEYYLSRFFKKQTGLSSRDYKKQFFASSKNAS
jgi:AraC-like DNA-binding protein